jgi:restriction system protein
MRRKQMRQTRDAEYRGEDFNLMSSDAPADSSLDQTYHYPPELLEMLTEAIPCLFKGKQAVINFFEGAGTPRSFLVGWRAKVLADRNSVKKHEIARDVLRKLNEGGDKTLAPRREVIKRICAIDDFSTCYDNDRHKAQSLVAQISRVVNVRDSFTRMNMEREKEQQQRLNAQKEAAAKIRQQREERQKIRTEFYALFSTNDAHKRGKALEGILNRLFASFNMLVCEAFTVCGEPGEGVIEQIDGVVEITGHLYLVEMKWWNQPIGRQEISPHLVSVYHRGNVGGIFIAYSGFSPAAIAEVKTALAQKVVVLMELQEVVRALDQDWDLKTLLIDKIQYSQMHKEPLHKKPP